MSLPEFEGEASLQAAADVTNAMEAAVDVTNAMQASTSTVSVSPVQQPETLYLMDEGEMEHRQKKRKLELQLLEEQIKTQQAIQKAMANIAQKYA